MCAALFSSSGEDLGPVERDPLDSAAKCIAASSQSYCVENAKRGGGIDQRGENRTPIRIVQTKPNQQENKIDQRDSGHYKQTSKAELLIEYKNVGARVTISAGGTKIILDARDVSTIAPIGADLNDMRVSLEMT